MPNTIVYTLVSHNFGMLPAQVAALRKYVDDLSRIVVVQGPFGAHDAFSAGDRCLLDDTADELGVEIDELDGQFGGLSVRVRVRRLVDYAKTMALAAPERFAFVLHGDTFPRQQTNAVATLAGFSMALRGRSDGDRYDCFHTWAAFDTEDPAVQHSQIWRDGVKGSASYKLYPSSLVYEKEEHFPLHLCEPSWLHLGRGHILTADETQQRLRIASKSVGMELPYRDPSVCIDGPLPLFPPKTRFRESGKTMHIRRKSRRTATMSPEQRQREIYIVAIQRWVDKGGPLRDDEATDMIYEKLCQPCSKCVQGACAGCGCGLQGDEEGLRTVLSAFDEACPIRNKIKLATEHCPLWRW